MFEWSNNYSVGICSIDAQHQNIFAMHVSCTPPCPQGKASLGRIVDRLVPYTSVHFAHEERLMRLHDYPDFAAHKAEHGALVRQVLKFQEDFTSGRATITAQVLQFLRDWLQNHTQGSDLKYAPHLKQRAVA